MPLYRGSGGAVFDITPPERGNLKELFQQRIAAGDLVLVGDAPAEAERAELEPTSDAPPHSAPKAEWVAYAVSLGWTEGDAEDATKAALIEALG